MWPLLIKVDMAAILDTPLEKDLRTNYPHMEKHLRTNSPHAEMSLCINSLHVERTRAEVVKKKSALLGFHISVQLQLMQLE